MLNKCRTCYVVTGDISKVEELRNNLESLISRSRRICINNSYVPSSYWIGLIVVHLLQLNTDDVSCNGVFRIKRTGSYGVICIETETELEPCRDCFKILSEKYDVKIFYLVKNLDRGLFETNDVDARYFKDRIIIESDEETVSFHSQEKAKEYIEEKMGMKFKSWWLASNTDIVLERFSIYEVEVYRDVRFA